MQPLTLFWSSVAFAFLLGSVIGSFLNVVIYRVPAGLSVVHPPSRCPVCETKIRWYDNIPILSWLILRGRCRHCKTPISSRYALVEALTGVLTAALWYKSAGPTLNSEMWPPEIHWAAILLPFGLHCLLVWTLIAIAFVDLDHFIIPHEFTLPAIVVGLAYPWLMEWVVGYPHMMRVWPPVTPTMSLAGAIAGALSVVAIFYLYLAVRGLEGMGGGDVTLMAVVGAWLGWPALIFVFFASSVQGLLAAGLAVLTGADLIRDSAEVLAEPAPGQGEKTSGEDPEGGEESENSLPEPEDLLPSVEEIDREELVVADPEEEMLAPGLPAVPFGPFIALAAVEFLIFGPVLPPQISLVYFYL